MEHGQAMQTHTWKFIPEALQLNIPEIDAEHEAIFNLLACSKRCGLERRLLDPDLAESLLVKLRQHFATEERLAKEAGQDFSVHAQKHEELLRVVAKLMETIRSRHSNIFSLLRYVEYWCERHIAEEDRPLSECLKCLQRQTALMHE